MRTAIVASTLLGLASAVPQGVTSAIPPEGDTPKGCSASHSSKFEITVAQVTLQKRDIQPRADCGANGVLVMSLADGITKDAQGRTGYIASNGQFQFDAPPQTGAIYTSGFSLCEDNLFALGANKTFYRCLSGDFYNLYNINWAAQCEPVSILAIPCGAASGASQGGDGQVSQGGDGQIVGTTLVHTTIVTALPDGQPQVVTTEVPVPVTSYYPTSAAVTQISDGQIQVPPPQTATSVATASVPAVTTAAPVPSSPAASGSASAPAVPSTSAASSPKPTSSAAASTSAAASSSAPAATTSAPGTSGSSRAAASIGALLVALIGFALL